MSINPLPRFSSALRGLLLTLLAIAGATVTAGCATDAAVISQANTFHGELEPAVMDDEVLDNYIQSVGDRILLAAREMEREGRLPKVSRNKDNSWMFSGDVRFHFVNSKTLNAFTTGGKHMYIYNELFQQCETEDELAAVMAHEFAHIYGRHVQKGMDRQYLILGGAAAAGAAGYAAGGSERGGEYAGLAAGGTLLAGQFLGMGFTRRDEAEADAYGFEMYARAGWDPARFGDFFQTMIDKGYDKGPAFLSDHPTLASRVEDANRRAAELGPEYAQFRQDPVAGPRRFKDLQARAARLGKTLPSDQTLEGTKELLASLPRSCLTPAVTEEQMEAERRVLARQTAGSSPQPSRRTQ